MLEPYADDQENLGVMQMTQEEIAKVGGSRQGGIHGGCEETHFG